MSKELNYICCQPDDNYFVWQVHLWVENLRELGQSSRAIVLVFTPLGRQSNKPSWQKVIDLYPEVEFVFYNDEHKVSNHLGIYIPVLRPYLLWRYWMDNPSMEEKTVFYYDCDVLLTDAFDISALVDDDTCYLSDTNDYINASYFDSKKRDVLPERLVEYEKVDVLDQVTRLIGVNRQVAEANNLHSGGAQYLLKNINAGFWHKVMEDCITIRTFLMNVNQAYFESENKGFQSWCADMWAVLWNLWYTNHEVKVVPEMGFSWAPDPIEKLQTHKIYHNAGIVGETQDNYPCFFKAKYHGGLDPMKDPQIDIVLNHPESRNHCTWFYTRKLDELRKKYNLSY